MEHFIHARLLTSSVKVLLVGAGGTGSRTLESLMCLHRALVAKGHPHGLEVTVADPDKVSAANIGRQTFYACDVGFNKAVVLTNRVNMALNGAAVWRASPFLLEATDDLTHFDIVIGAVDSRAARAAILTAMTRRHAKAAYWLDFGNKAEVGQVVLGEVEGRHSVARTEPRLPHAGELFPDLVDPQADTEDDGPSCSLAQALEKQSLFVNQAVSIQGMTILWNLFTKGSIASHGAFVSTENCEVHPLHVEIDVWKRFGYKPKYRRRRAAVPA